MCYSTLSFRFRQWKIVSYNRSKIIVSRYANSKIYQERCFAVIDLPRCWWSVARRQKRLHAIIWRLRVLHRRYSKAVNLSNHRCTLHAELYSVILRLFSYCSRPSAVFNDTRTTFRSRWPDFRLFRVRNSRIPRCKKEQPGKLRDVTSPLFRQWLETKLHRICTVSQPIVFGALFRIALYYVVL